MDLAADDARDVRAVAVAVGRGRIDKVGDLRRPAAEVGMRGVDARVEDVGAGPRAGRVVEIGCCAWGAGGDARETPGGVGLLGQCCGGRRGEDGVLLDVVNLLLSMYGQTDFSPGKLTLGWSRRAPRASSASVAENPLKAPLKT